ncbi:hypothetical protein [Bdellovibrio sp. KM01]|uniref:hypothetical protein n=1 Tax=Bdellovibrio sp. KM01 TaxID=2748865 RepID=UPI0015EB0592|nr:hypothetical protein [Bdellovibrio sp. KM01]QLY23951.1 hypothetical protein HW988_10700 [Bdellovibrio sp. KM01]
MGNSFRLFLCGLFLSVPVLAAESSFKGDLLEVLQIYAKQNNLGLNKPSNNFMGFSITAAGSENKVTVYHADSPIDVILNDYVCSNQGCQQVARDPRCFYYTPGGSYSAMAIYEAAFQQAQIPRPWGIGQLKFWQLGATVYGRISSPSADSNELYSCSVKQADLVCESALETPDEP